MFLFQRKYREFLETPKNSSGHFYLLKSANLLIYRDVLF